jgi:hypothetical protein
MYVCPINNYSHVKHHIFNLNYCVISHSLVGILRFLYTLYSHFHKSEYPLLPRLVCPFATSFLTLSQLVNARGISKCLHYSVGQKSIRFSPACCLQYIYTGYNLISYIRRLGLGVAAFSATKNLQCNATLLWFDLDLAS